MPPQPGGGRLALVRTVPRRFGLSRTARPPALKRRLLAALDYLADALAGVGLITLPIWLSKYPGAVLGSAVGLATSITRFT